MDKLKYHGLNLTWKITILVFPHLEQQIIDEFKEHMSFFLKQSLREGIYSAFLQWPVSARQVYIWNIPATLLLYK